MRVGLAGFGTAGQEVARRLAAGANKGARLTAVTARDLDKARASAAKLTPAPAVVPLGELPTYADAIAECTTAEALPEILLVCLRAGRTVLVVSAAGLLGCPDADAIARRAGGRLRIANGALPGLDALRSAREAAAAFPHHCNVAVALAIAGIGCDRVEIEVLCRPHRRRCNPSGGRRCRGQRPYDGQPQSASANPRTSRIVAPTIVAGLRARVAPLVAGG